MKACKRLQSGRPARYTGKVISKGEEAFVFVTSSLRGLDQSPPCQPAHPERLLLRRRARGQSGSFSNEALGDEISHSRQEKPPEGQKMDRSLAQHRDYSAVYCW